jgi:hypothetical protein
VYHDFEALLDCEARAEAIVHSWGLDAKNNNFRRKQIFEITSLNHARLS